MKNYYQIAGLKVEMESFGKTEKQAQPYLVPKPEKIDISIHSCWPELKEKYPELDDETGEYLGTGKDFYRKLLNFEGMMLHSSAVVVDNRAYLFSAPSGTGKSTHTELWLKAFGEKAYILNDDKPAVREVNGSWYAYGTPWSGKHDISVNKGVPIAGIAFIERSPNNSIERIYGINAVKHIITQVNRKTESAEFREKLLELLDKMLRKIPIWKLYCNMDMSAAIVSYKAMSSCKMEE